MSKYPDLDLSQVKTYSVYARKSKVQVKDFARVTPAPGQISAFIDSWPNILKASDFKVLIQKIVSAVTHHKLVIIMMGAHVIKCGLNPLLIELMHRGVLKHLALNGAGAIHDTELAYWGTTSEDVAEGLQDGMFGMARETGELVNGSISAAKDSDLGFGEALGRKIIQDQAEYKNFSLLANAWELDIPVTVHVGIGTDIVHQQPTADGAAIGALSFRDFRLFAAQLCKIDNQGVVLNLGSSVILPEVFLKALTVARNLGHPAFGFTTANFDMLQHYRPRVNVVERPTMKGGTGYQFTGHHEIMIPLLAAAILEQLTGTTL